MVKIPKNCLTTGLLAALAMTLGFGIVFSALHHMPLSKAADARRPKHQGSQNSKDMPPVKAVSKNWYESRQSIYFDIPARILIKHPDNPKAAQGIINEAWREFERIGRIFNPYDPESEVAELNQAGASGKINVSADLYQVLKTSKELFAASQGRFDPTCFRIKQLWRHAEDAQDIPSDRDILKALQGTGLENVELAGGQSGDIWIDNPAIRFDFGGIAKGYAVDCVRKVLKANGVSHGLVQLGGEIAAFGENDGEPWRIGIQDPKNMQNIWGVVERRADTRVSTSGNYRQPLRIQGRTFYHIFSPETGRPVPERVLGVTTAGVSEAHSNALIDGAATAITVMGAADGIQFAQNLGIEALILTQAGDNEITEHMTPGFQKYYERRQPAH
jgi:thiamine biosynthesis lipoprotein